jgi:GNAT superfamily N-acetyltransferase
VSQERLEWRGEFDNREVNDLHAEAFGHAVLPIDWGAQIGTHSLGWVTARDAGRLVGFVNVAWDGGVHAFLIDTMVLAERRGEGIGTRLVRAATEGARAAGCEWLHVDFDEELRPFYFDSCRFRSTPAGVIPLHERKSGADDQLG